MELIEDIVAQRVVDRTDTIVLIFKTTKNRYCTIFVELDANGAVSRHGNAAVKRIVENTKGYFTHEDNSFLRKILGLPKNTPRPFAVLELKGLPVSVLKGLTIVPAEENS